MPKISQIYEMPCQAKIRILQKITLKDKWNKIYKNNKKLSFENIQHTEMVKESKSLNIISSEGVFFVFYLD